MKKVLFAALFMALGALFVVIGWALSDDGIQDPRLESRIEDLESINEEPLDGVMISTGQYFTLFVTFEEGLITNVKLCDLLTGECESEDAGDTETVWYQGEYVWMVMEMNAFLLEREEAKRAELEAAQEVPEE